MAHQHRMTSRHGETQWPSRLKHVTPAALAYALLLGYALLSLYPFLWMISASLKSNAEVLTNDSLIPNQVRLDILLHVWGELDFWKYLLNSLAISLLVIFGVVLIYSLAGYGFAKTRFFGKEAFYLGFLALLFVPGVTVLIPLVYLLRTLGFIGPDATQWSTYAGLALPVINGAGPLAILLFRSYFAQIPTDLHDAARIDGSSEWGIYWRIYFPLSWPVIATVGTLNFITTWNAYIWPSIVINNPAWYTLPLKLRDLNTSQFIQWNVQMAGSLITTLPILLVFLFLQRYYIQSLTGAVKN